MLEDILSNIDNPRQLERLYRDNKPAFKATFNDLYPQLRKNLLADGWYQRLNYSSDALIWGTPDERIFVMVASLVAIFLAKLPKIFSIDQEFFYTRNIGFIVFPILIAYFSWNNKISGKTTGILAALATIAVVFINALPNKPLADTLNLSCIHLPLLLWTFLAFVFGGGKRISSASCLNFLRYNGELLVMTALLLIAGGLMSGLTVGLFELVGWEIKHFYFEYVVVCGLAALPVVASFLIRTQPTLVNKVSPLIANLFSPIALVMLVVYLAAILFSNKDPYHDREFLMLFNVLLVGVMALIFFSVAETTSPGGKSRVQILILFLLSAVTLIVNGIALSAVLFRISEWGITPNRAAVSGANVLMLAHLIYVSIALFRTLAKKDDLPLVGKSMAVFLPIYASWCAIVTFLFPVIFGFK